jgi:tropomyosin, fungi type
MESDQAHAKAEEHQNRVKALEQGNLEKDQEITSLNHKNQLLEVTVEKLEKEVEKLKHEADTGAQHGTQNEALQRRLQLLEEEAEEADKNLRETNDK